MPQVGKIHICLVKHRNFTAPARRHTIPDLSKLSLVESLFNQFFRNMLDNLTKY